MNAAPASACFHCGNPVPQGCDASIVLDGMTQPLCCAGCEAAARLILSQGLERYYQFRARSVVPPLRPQPDWLTYDRKAALRRYTHQRADGSCELSVRLEGLHCSACVWLIENSLQHTSGVLAVYVNLSERRAQLRYDPRKTELSALLATLHRLGFPPRPISYLCDADDGGAERRTALKRLAVAGFGMMQVMTFAVSLYVGAIEGMTPDLEQLLRFVSLIVATPVVLYAAQPFFVAAWRSVHQHSLGMDVPVALSIGGAYLWSVGATVLGKGTVYFDSAVMFTFLLLLGRYVEMALRHNAGREHESLSRLLPESVLRVSGDRTESVMPEELQAGDRIRVLAGQRLAADGVIAAGASEVDESLLTGESSPRSVRLGQTVTAGSLNLNGLLEVTVTRIGQDSTLAAVSRLLERAHASRPAFADLADQVATWFVGGILLLALGVGLYWWHTDAQRALSVVLAVLVVTCPCALSLATPAALASATTRLARSGLLVTRGRALERLARADCAIFDKTGTLTRGRPQIERVRLLDPRMKERRCLSIAAALESRSSHPLAYAFADFDPAADVTASEIAPGRGVEAQVGGVVYRIGRVEYVRELSALCHCVQSVTTPAIDEQTSVVLGDSRGLIAQFLLLDTLRTDAQVTMGSLRALGLTLQIASGDRPAVVTACAKRLGISEARGGLTAADKVSWVRALQSAGHRVLMVGDGINDAPVLAVADVSVAVGGGTDLAQVSADVILLGERLDGLHEAIETSRKMMQIVRQNIVWAVIYNATAVPLAAGGWLEPWMAAVGMAGSSLLVVLNAMRILPRRATPALPAASTIAREAPA